jgi:hypothetical protein
VVLKYQKTNATAKHGFALVIALSLMAFILVLVLSMSLFVQVETATSSTALAQLRAKESAKLALFMALGDLQRHAGPDQRVTARAEILGSGLSMQNPFWTGVWDTTNPAAAPRWLVSWQNQIGSPGSMMQLVGEGTVGPDNSQYVDAPTIDVLGRSDTPSAEIAWWISDEGVKASAGLSDQIDEVDDRFFENFSPTGLSALEQRQLLRQISPRRFRTELFLGDNTDFTPGKVEDITQASVQERVDDATLELSRTVSIRQLELIGGIDSSEVESAFHSMTYLSKAVLSNSNKGGLRRDLSDQSYNDSSGAIVVDDRLRSFLWDSSPDSNGKVELMGLTDEEIGALNAGNPVATAPALITEFGLFFAVSGQGSSSSTARAFLRLEAEVWSPYGFRHKFAGSSGSGTPELIVEIEGLPSVELTFFDKDQEAFTNSQVLDLNSLEPTFKLDLTGTHKAGEIRKTNGIWPVNASSNQTSFYYSNNWSWVVDDPSTNSDHRYVSFPDGDSIRYASSETDITLILKNTIGETLQRIENIPIGAINTDCGFFVDKPSDLDSSDAPIVFYYRVFDERADLEKWLTEIDPRSINLDLKDPDVFDIVDINDDDGDDLGDADIPPLDAFSNLDLLHGQPNNNFFRLFDVPATIPYSLGVLQHLNLHKERPFSIGNSWGGTRNAVFDQYFISSIPQDAGSSFWTPDTDPFENPLPNPSLEVYPQKNTLTLAEIAGSKSARHLLVSGSFNINSTSAEAWQAVLASNYIYDWQFKTNVGTSTETSANRINLEGSHFRLPFSGHYRSKSFSDWKFPFEDYEQELTVGDDYPALLDSERELIFKNPNGVDSLNWKPSLAIGHRENTDAALGQIADKIVEALKLRGRPFTSLEEFVSSGLLQESIDQTPVNTILNGTSYAAASDNDRLPRNTSAFLSQADIISSLAPYMSARSDTFMIHATATSRNTLSGAREGTASCIALVQRVPTRHDANDAAIMDNATGFGRRYIVKDIQWLDSSQL